MFIIIIHSNICENLKTCIGSIFDSDMFFSDQINSVSKSILSFSHPRHPSSATFPSFYSHSSCKFIYIQQTLLLWFTILCTSHTQISTNFEAFKTHWHVSLQTLQNINASYHRHQYSKYYTTSNQGSITNSICLIMSKEAFSACHWPTTISRMPKTCRESLCSCDYGIHSLLIHESRHFYQYSVQSSKRTSSRYYYDNKHMSNWLSRFRCWRSIRTPPCCAFGVFSSVAYKFGTRRRVSVLLWLTRADKPGLADIGRGGKGRHNGKTR